MMRIDVQYGPTITGNIELGPRTVLAGRFGVPVTSRRFIVGCGVQRLGLNIYPQRRLGSEA